MKSMESLDEISTQSGPKSEPPDSVRLEDFQAISLQRNPAGEFGLSLTLDVKGQRPGVYVSKVVEGSPADKEGSVQEGDKVVAINGVGIIGVGLMKAQRMLEQSGKSVELKVSRNGVPVKPNNVIGDKVKKFLADESLQKKAVEDFDLDLGNLSDESDWEDLSSENDGDVDGLEDVEDILAVLEAEHGTVKTTLSQRKAKPSGKEEKHVDEIPPPVPDGPPPPLDVPPSAVEVAGPPTPDTSPPIPVAPLPTHYSQSTTPVEPPPAPDDPPPVMGSPPPSPDVAMPAASSVSPPWTPSPSLPDSRSATPPISPHPFMDLPSSNEEDVEEDERASPVLDGQFSLRDGGVDEGQVGGVHKGGSDNDLESDHGQGSVHDKDDLHDDSGDRGADDEDDHGEIDDLLKTSYGDSHQANDEDIIPTKRDTGGIPQEHTPPSGLPEPRHSPEEDGEVRKVNAQNKDLMSKSKLMEVDDNEDVLSSSLSESALINDLSLSDDDFEKREEPRRSASLVSSLFGKRIEETKQTPFSRSLSLVSEVTPMTQSYSEEKLHFSPSPSLPEEDLDFEDQHSLSNSIPHEKNDEMDLSGLPTSPKNASFERDPPPVMPAASTDKTMSSPRVTSQSPPLPSPSPSFLHKEPPQASPEHPPSSLELSKVPLSSLIKSPRSLRGSLMQDGAYPDLPLPLKVEEPPLLAKNRTLTLSARGTVDQGAEVNSIGGPTQVGENKDSQYTSENGVTWIELDKPASGGLGFSLIGKERGGMTSVFIKTITPDGVAERDGRLKVGDKLLQVNGQSTVGMTQNKVIALLRKSKRSVKLAVTGVGKLSRPSSMTGLDRTYELNPSAVIPPLKLPVDSDQSDDEFHMKPSVPALTFSPHESLTESTRDAKAQGYPSMQFSEADDMNSVLTFDSITSLPLEGLQSLSLQTPPPRQFRDDWSSDRDTDSDIESTADLPDDSFLDENRSPTASRLVKEMENALTRQNRSDDSFGSDLDLPLSSSSSPLRAQDAPANQPITEQELADLCLIDPPLEGRYRGQSLRSVIALLQKKIDKQDPEEEFKMLRQLKAVDNCQAAKNPANKDKNRFRNVLPYDKTRVILKSGQSDYINANHIKLKVGDLSQHFIACQGPLPTTMDDFWTMIWEQAVEVIAMVTLDVEGGKLKCHRYWPESLASTMTTRDLIVHLDVEKKLQHFYYRKMTITHSKTLKSHEVVHLNFTSWPDHSVPSSAFPLLRYIGYIRQLIDGSRPLVVHCSAGIGRTGTLITLHHVLALIDNDLDFKIPDVVKELRLQRQGMIQTKDQYLFCYKAAVEVLKTLL